MQRGAGNPGLSQEISINLLRMRTYINDVRKPFEMRTYKNIRLKVTQNEHLQKTLWERGGRTEQPPIEPMIEVVVREKATHRMRFRA